jgi:putative ABC transport system permease protein
MRDWQVYVREHLALLDFDPKREEKIVTELAAQLEEAFLKALSRGMSEAEADGFARCQIQDWECFASEIRRADPPGTAARFDRWTTGPSGHISPRIGGMMLLTNLFKDVTYAARMLRRSPGFAAVALLTLSVGIGGTTAIFSVVHAMLLTPLPFPEPERLVMVWEKNYVRGVERNGVSSGNFIRWRERNQVFADLALMANVRVSFSDEDETTFVPSGYVTGNFFEVLGAGPFLGRTLTPADSEPGAPAVIVLSHAYWQGRYGGDPDIVGSIIKRSSGSLEIVGVMPPEFSVPSGVKLWFPFTLSEGVRESRRRWLTTVARLRDGVSLDEARAAMETLGQQLEEERPKFNAGWNISVFPLHNDLVGLSVRRNLVESLPLLLMILMGAVSFVLLIACANVANLLLARAAGREREMAVRAALGAGRGRLLRQLFTESLLLASLGGVGGVVLGYLGLEGLLSIAPAEIPTFVDITLDGRVLGFTVLISLLTGILFGLVPALGSSSPDLLGTLRGGGRTGGGLRPWIRNLLVVSEVALALILLAGAGLVLRSFVGLITINPGFDARNVLTFQIAPSRQNYPTQEQRTQFYQVLQERLVNLPGVESVGAISLPPIASSGFGTSFVVLDRPEPAASEQPVATVWAVEGRLHEALGIRLLRGRGFTRADSAEAPNVVIVNEGLVREFWPDENPLGKRIRMRWGGWIEVEIVGVVNDARLRGLDTAPRATLYWPEAQLPFPHMTFMVRSEGNASALGPVVREQIKALDPALPVSSLQTMESVISHSLRQPRFSALLLGLFAATAVLLAALGVYGVISYTVSRRTHEIGVRMALGAGTGDILRAVMRQGVTLAVIGVGIGLTGAFALTRRMEALLFETSPTDPVTFAGVSVLLIFVTALGCYLPARRATQVDPMVALRYE